MRKIWFLAGTILLSLSLLLGGCGVSQELYDTAVTNFDIVQQEMLTAQTELESLQKLYDDSQADIKSIQGEHNVALSTIETMEQSIAKARLEAEIIGALFVPALKDELEATNPFVVLFDWKDNVKATDDPVLQAKFDAVLATEGADEELTDFFVYLFEDMIGTLQ